MSNYSTFVKLILENFERALNSILAQFNGVSISFSYTVSDTVTRKTNDDPQP